jgi:VWFA-related protein
MGRALTLLFVAPLAALQPGVPSERQAAQFGTGIDVIHLNVSVTDGHHRYVAGLTAADFVVLEDGVRQDVSLFTQERMPISLVLLVDCSASMEEKLPTAQAAALRFIRTLAREDRAQIVQFNEHSTVLQDFTSEPGLLEAAVRGFRASGTTALYNTLYVALKSLAKEAEAGQLRRRAIVLLTDGEDTASLVTDDQILELARTLEIAIYPIGLQSERPFERTRAAHAQAIHFLTALANQTGGEVQFPSMLSQLDAVYGRVAEQLRTEYTLGYVSQNRRRDGKWRRVAVRTPGHDDLQVRHKVGYYAPRE